VLLLVRWFIFLAEITNESEESTASKRFDRKLSVNILVLIRLGLFDI
jgi:hypothetical protein